MILTQAGFQIDTAENGQIAVEKVSAAEAEDLVQSVFVKALLSYQATGSFL